MAGTFVQKKDAVDVGNFNPHTLAFDSSVTAGSTLFCAVRALTGTTITSVADDVNAGNYTLDQTATCDNGTYVALYRRDNCTAGATTVTATFTGSVTISWVIFEVSGLATSGVLDDADNSFGDNVTTHTSPSITTSGADRFIVALLTVESGTPTITPNGGETERSDTGRLQLQTKAAATAGSYTTSWTLDATSDVAGIIAAYNPGGATITGSGAPASGSDAVAGFGGITSPVLKPFISPVTSVRVGATSVSGSGTLG